jgi:hypothetical protein
MKVAALTAVNCFAQQVKCRPLALPTPHGTTAGACDGDDGSCYFIKGSIEGVLDLCATYAPDSALPARGPLPPAAAAEAEEPQSSSSAPAAAAPAAASWFSRSSSAPAVAAPNQSVTQGLLPRLSDGDRQLIGECAGALAARGLRVLALAHGQDLGALTFDGEQPDHHVVVFVVESLI